MIEDKKVEKKESEAEKKEVSKKPAGLGEKKEKLQKRKYTRKESRRGRRRKPDKSRSEYDQKILNIRRVTRVVAGGRRFSFSVAMVIGNRKGSVGVGLGKGTDTSLAIEKAVRSAKKNLIKPRLTENSSIPFDVEAKYCSSRVVMAPKPGGGLKAGSSVRTVLELLGATDISAKILSRSKNKINNARATTKALKKLNITHSVATFKKMDKKDKTANTSK